MHVRAAGEALRRGDVPAAQAAAEDASLWDADSTQVLKLLADVRDAHELQQFDIHLAAAGKQLEAQALPQALELVDQALALRPTAPAARDLRRAVVEAIEERDRQRQRAQLIDRSLRAAREALAVGTPEAAIRAVSEVLAYEPTHAEAAALKRFSNRPCTTWGGRGTSAHTDAGGPMRAYSMDLRARALLDSDAGMQAADVAAKYRVSGSWVRRLKQRRRDTGEVAPRVQRHGRRCMREPHLHTVAALIAAHPDRTLAELTDALATPASVPTVWRAVRALGLTVQQNGTPVRTRSA